MVKFLILVVMLSLAAVPASAQSTPLYVGGTIGVNGGYGSFLDRVGTFPVVGGFIGLRFHDAWSIEFQVDRGFGKSAEREAIEIFGRSTVLDRVGDGYALLVTWKSRKRSRVGVAVTMGMAVRKFRTDRLSVTRDIPGDTYPAPLGTKYKDGGAGWTGGVLFPIALGGGCSLAPEIRVTPIALTGESGAFRVFNPSVRLMWGF